MNCNQQFSLKNYNSFNVEAICPNIYFPNSLNDLMQLAELTRPPFYILGEGSNTLFTDQQVPTIIKPNFLGIDIVEFDNCFEVTVGAGENWHNLVEYCIGRGINGLENLALIPGSVGAAPVQNIGAYGVEFADFCKNVEYFDLTQGELKNLTKAQCQFSYRDSIFKSLLCNKAIITKIILIFPKKWQANLGYQGLNHLTKNVSAKEIMQQVILVRQQKLPDPEALPNAGSFFKNPIVAYSVLNALQATYPNIPFYDQDENSVKLAAGWLIEQSGLKGYQANGVGVHQKQALVLVNHNSNCGQDVVILAKYVQNKVLEKFGIILAPEVRLVGKQGEYKFETLIASDE